MYRVFCSLCVFVCGLFLCCTHVFAEPAGSGTTLPGFWLGSTQADVTRIQGVPDSVETIGSDEVWTYGHSTVKFRNGLVSGYANLSRNLKMQPKNTEPSKQFESRPSTRYSRRYSDYSRVSSGSDSGDRYIADLNRRIKRAWFPPRGNESKRVEVEFFVQRDGELSDLRLVSSSGLTIADQAGMKAVENAAPFRPLPPDFPAPQKVNFVFDYSVFSGGGSATFVN